MDKIATKTALEALAQAVNDKITELEESSGGDVYVETTWLELKNLRDNSQLSPGTWYRITDYQTTTVQTNTQSAGHQFDILVQALDINILGEECKATRHSGDSYFANNNLNAWKIWYHLDNDNTVFKWADTTNGKGVIYRMIDEWNNDCAYDFKNIMFKVSPKVPSYSEIKSTVFYYTFSLASGSNDSTVTDYSLNGVKCNNNKIGSYKWDTNDSEDTYRLPFNIFRNAGSANYIKCFGNILENNCYNNLFNYNSYNNIFEQAAHENELSYSCSGNHFRQYSNTNYLAYGCSSNFIAGRNNYLGSQCWSNIIKDKSVGIRLGNQCMYNTLGIYVRETSLGYNCSGIIINNTCNKIEIGANCNNISIGNGCEYIILGSVVDTTSSAKSYMQNIIIENGIKYVNAYCTGTTSSSQYCQNVRLTMGIMGTSSSTRKQIDITSCIGSTVNNVYQPTNSTITNV